ncbi:hypothetical protein COMNV_00778 [Commensalibacter sp. Nvir]|uniref:hypothetical protein n=1 Tax=Commensalibacter sp. Nvir TaxID=3069817 RepID=UPI002D719868|nr:hypothetical protein COMNV_00778 [Commensalibacter sp. Nvir]
MKAIFSFIIKYIAISSVFILSSCALDSSRTSLATMQKRVNESRNFEAPDQAYLLQTVITTLQDQGYNILKVNNSNYEITAQRDGNILLTIIIYNKGPHLFTVRANAQNYSNQHVFSFNSTGYELVTDPVFYQQEFFNPLSKSLFLKKENLFN